MCERVRVGWAFMSQMEDDSWITVKLFLEKPDDDSPFMELVKDQGGLVPVYATMPDEPVYATKPEDME